MRLPDHIVIDFGDTVKYNGQGTLYIIDFGIAEADVTTSTLMGDVCGTRGWRAPEIQKGQM